MRTSRLLASLSAGALLAVFPLAAAAPAYAATPAEALAATSGYGGYTTGTAVYANAVNLTDPDVAKISIAQSAAGAAIGEPLVTQDLLDSTILFEDPAGKNAYGHGASANVGALQAENAVPQIDLATAEALSPPPSTETNTNELGTLPADPLATVQLLPSSARANTTSLNSICVTNPEGLISSGTAQAANAQLLSPAEGQNLVTADGEVDSQSGLLLQDPVAGAAGNGLTSVTTQSLAPLTLFKGIPGAETTIQVLHKLQLSSTAGGVAGSAKVFYGFVDAEGNQVPDSEPVLLINGEGLTSEQVIGGDGIQLSLGVADVFIGAPAHGLNDDPTTDPQIAANGTQAAAAADFIRIKVPGTVTTGSTMPVAEDSPLAPILNPVLTPVIEGLDPVLTGLQDALEAAGLEAADLRYGHLEALATVPVGGIICGAGGNPFDESFKDVSTFSVAPGQTFEYTVRFPNRSTEPVTNVKVVDTYDARLEFVSSDPPPTSRSGNTLTYDVGTLQPGEFVDISFTFRAPADARPGTVYRNDAKITGTFQGAPVSKDVSVVGPTVIDRPTGPCDVSRSTKFASNLEVVTGQQFAYFINVSNTGGAACTNVTITDTLTPGVEFVSCSDGCTRSGRTLTFKLGTLASGASRTVSFVVRTTATSGRLPNTGTITTAEGSTARPATPGPEVTRRSVVSPGKPAGCPASGCPRAADDQLPRTGGGAVLPVLGALVLGLGLWTRRRSMTS